MRRCRFKWTTTYGRPVRRSVSLRCCLVNWCSLAVDLGPRTFNSSHRPTATTSKAAWNRSTILRHHCDIWTIFTCAPAILRAGSFFGGVCVRVCSSVRTKSRKLPFRNRCNLIGIRTMVNARRCRKLVTLDVALWPWKIFSSFLNSSSEFWMP